MTAQEVGEILRLSEKTVYAYARQGRIGCVRLSARVIRFRPEDVEGLVARNVSGVVPLRKRRAS